MSSTDSTRPLEIAILGTRGIPAGYGGFETFAEELATRLVERGHAVTVYGRPHFVNPDLRLYRGVEIRVLPCLRHKYLDTVSHTTLSVAAAALRRYDIILMCNAANAFLCWIPRLAGQKVVLNVDGIERRRKKWNLLGQAFYRLGEFLATQFPDQVVSDARVIQQYYLEEYGFRSRFIPYGAPVGCVETRETLDRLGLEPASYLLYVSRLEPENNAHLVVQAYLQSEASLPLVVVGDAPYSEAYIQHLRRLADGKSVFLPGAIYGIGYRELLSHTVCYIHATEVGGTHPALLEAMGAGCVVLVNDTPENREVVGDAGLLYPFNDLKSLSRLIREVSSQPHQYAGFKELAQQRVRQAYDWEQVVSHYEGLFYELVAQ